MARYLILIEGGGGLPAIIAAPGRKTRDRIEHVLHAAINNANTRIAYGRALASFFAFLEDGGTGRVQNIGPLDVRDYFEAAKGTRLFAATLKQHMGAIRMQYDHLVTGGVIAHNPALSVKAPRQTLGKGKTPALSTEEAGQLLRSIETSSVVGLRALIGVVVFTFARASAACGINVGDVFHQNRRVSVRLHEKGGMFHEMPCHRTLEGYLAEYRERARLGETGRVPLLKRIKHRPFGRGAPELNGERFCRVNAWKMVQRRAKAAGIRTDVRNHTFRQMGPRKSASWLTRLLASTALTLMPVGVSLADVTAVTSCPGQAKIPVSFQIDCSHVRDGPKKLLCRPFIENVACKVFPAYRKITGVKLETRCRSIGYTIYEDPADWPHKATPSGGISYECRVDYMAQYSILYRSGIGPYDVHEILHHYHFGLVPLPNQHSLFEPAMIEARREIGDAAGYQRFLAIAKSGADRDPGKNCYAAQSAVENSLYLENSRNVYRFYRDLDRRPMDASQRLNRLLLSVSGQKPSVRTFLVDHGCPARW